MRTLSILTTKRSRGAVVIEFALLAMLFFAIIFGIVDFGRWLFTMDAAAEATRWGARLAVVCSKDNVQIKRCMARILPGLTDDKVAITYYDVSGVNPACDSSNCTSVAVQINGMTLNRFFPVPPFAMPISSFPTRMTREMMQNSWVCNCPY